MCDACWMRSDALHVLIYNMVTAASINRKLWIRFDFSTINTLSSIVSNTERLIFTMMPTNSGSWSSKRCIFPVVRLYQGRSVFTPVAPEWWPVVRLFDPRKGLLYVDLFTPAQKVWPNRGNKLWFIYSRQNVKINIVIPKINMNNHVSVRYFVSDWSTHGLNLLRCICTSGIRMLCGFYCIVTEFVWKYLYSYKTTINSEYWTGK